MFQPFKFNHNKAKMPPKTRFNKFVHRKYAKHSPKPTVEFLPPCIKNFKQSNCNRLTLKTPKAQSKQVPRFCAFVFLFFVYKFRPHNFKRLDGKKDQKDIHPEKLCRFFGVLLLVTYFIHISPLPKPIYLFFRLPTFFRLLLINLPLLMAQGRKKTLFPTCFSFLFRLFSLCSLENTHFRRQKLARE